MKPEKPPKTKFVLNYTQNMIMLQDNETDEMGGHNRSQLHSMKKKTEQL
jgi:hypothetical protein